MTIYVNFTSQEMKLIKDYAKSHNIETADFIKRIIMNKIKEDPNYAYYHQLHNQNKYSSEDEFIVLLDTAKMSKYTQRNL